ncbi:hypothetical protein B0H14DRAFT_2578577 [Mycena olivaceomarginata]|nr:hypothetical protein B0H14DRAFT_2578577 [Mycena olivaceomarginata]
MAAIYLAQTPVYIVKVSNSHGMLKYLGPNAVQTIKQESNSCSLPILSSKIDTQRIPNHLSGVQCRDSIAAPNDKLNDHPGDIHNILQWLATIHPSPTELISRFEHYLEISVEKYREMGEIYIIYSHGPRRGELLVMTKSEGEVPLLCPSYAGEAEIAGDRFFFDGNVHVSGMRAEFQGKVNKFKAVEMEYEVRGLRLSFGPFGMALWAKFRLASPEPHSGSANIHSALSGGGLGRLEEDV